VSNKYIFIQTKMQIFCIITAMILII